MKKRNKRQELLKLLQKGWTLSKLQIIDKVGLINSGDAVMQLREKGYNIQMKKVENKNTGSRFGVYFIPDRVKDIDLILKSYNV